jgi:hypothetical protein
MTEWNDHATSMRSGNVVTGSPIADKYAALGNVVPCTFHFPELPRAPGVTRSCSSLPLPPLLFSSLLSLASSLSTMSERRERKPSVGAPIADLQGPIGPGFSRPKHKRTFTGLGPSEIKNVEASIPEPLREA